MIHMSQTPPNPPSVPSAPGYGTPVPPGDGYQNPTPPYGAYQGGQYTPGQEPRYNVLAIVSLVSAFFLSLVAVITGHMALNQIKRTAEKGRGLAIAGLVLGYAGIVGGIISAIVLVVMAVAGIGLFATVASNYDPDDYSYTSEPTTVPDALGGDLTFEAGNDLDPTVVAQFADPFMMDSEWTVKEPDDGAGNWSYMDPSNQCSVSFHQGALSAATVTTDGDDRATTASFLGDLLSTDQQTIEDNASDGSFSYNVEGAGTVDTLVIEGTDDDGRNWRMAGRAFGELGSGLYVDVTCTAAGDLESVYDTVTTKAAIAAY
jgi:hypothetical protein